MLKIYTHLSVCWGAAQLELPLLADGLPFSTSGPAFVLMVTRDAYMFKQA